MNEASGPVATKSKTKRERFLAVAEKRTRRAIVALQRVARCGNRATYEYEDAEAEAILSAVEAEVKKLREAFAQRAIPGAFNLPSRF